MISINSIQIAEEKYFTALQEWWIRPIDSPDEFEFAEMCYNKIWVEYKSSHHYGAMQVYSLKIVNSNIEKNDYEKKEKQDTTGAS